MFALFTLDDRDLASSICTLENKSILHSFFFVVQYLSFLVTIFYGRNYNPWSIFPAFFMFTFHECYVVKLKAISPYWT